MKKKVQPKAAKAAFEPRVVADHNRHTAIEIFREDGVCKYIPLDILGLEVITTDPESFDKRFSQLPDYPVKKAAALYAEYSTRLGGSKEAMEFLASLTNLTPKEIEMATAKKAETKKAAPAKAAKAVKTAPAAKKKEDTGERKASAASRFKELIMEGKKTDDQIFAVVQKEFGLDESKKSYVKWYRNDLTKKGAKPPAAKGA